MDFIPCYKELNMLWLIITLLIVLIVSVWIIGLRLITDHKYQNEWITKTLRIIEKHNSL
jgi:hypothetical protein